MLTLDPWQKQVLATKGNIVLRSGRQVGKSTAIAIKAGDFACKHPKKTILVIASVERQAFLIFEKILAYIYDNHKTLIKRGKDRPTKSRIRLKNGSIIYCLPTGLSGYGIRGYTIDLLIADEAAFIPEEVWTAVTPMLAVTKGDIILLSTPFGKGGYFFRCFEDPTFTSFHVSSEDCHRITPEFLEQEKKRMTKLQYAQEYLGEFVDELRRFFSEELIRSCMQPFTTPPEGKNYLGVDIARMGRDDSVLFSIKEHKNNLYQIDLKVMEKYRLTETTKEVIAHDQRFNYKKIFIDDGGMGVGVFDQLLESPQTKRKVIPINNSSRGLDSDRDDGRKKRLLKEDLYNNLLSLMEQGRIKLHNDPDIALSLKSIQAEYTDSNKLKIFGTYSHITEALIRAAWCVKTKSLNIYIHY
jgi:hypothetical protein